MGQIKNIKLHIVTDIKLQSNMLQRYTLLLAVFCFLPCIDASTTTNNNNKQQQPVAVSLNTFRQKQKFFNIQFYSRRKVLLLKGLLLCTPIFVEALLITYDLILQLTASSSMM